MKRRFLKTRIALTGVLAAVLAFSAAAKPPKLILPHPSLLKAQMLLRQAEQAGAARTQPGVVLALQEKINAAWSAYHLQVEEKADDPDDKEAVQARQLAEVVELDAELLQASLRTHEDEAKLDAARAKIGRPPPERLQLPPPPSNSVPGAER